MSDIKIRFLSQREWKRGPGGHWFVYEATDGIKFGYGQTELEARRDLQSKTDAG